MVTRTELDAEYERLKVQFLAKVKKSMALSTRFWAKIFGVKIMDKHNDEISRMFFIHGYQFGIKSLRNRIEAVEKKLGVK